VKFKLFTCSKCEGVSEFRDTRDGVVMMINGRHECDGKKLKVRDRPECVWCFGAKGIVRDDCIKSNK
jgi:hypothetical protein